jgi:hypothetical protein
MLGHSIVSQHFTEPEGSIPNSQELSTCSYPEPDQSIHITPSHLSKIPLNTGCGKLTSFFEYEYIHIKKEVSLPHLLSTHLRLGLRNRET